MNVLYLSNLFPNKNEPTRGIFNYQQVLHLSKKCNITVLVPIPRFLSIFSKNRIIETAPIENVTVYYKKVFYIPIIGRLFNGYLYFYSLLSFMKSIQKKYSFDVIFATWVYPDAFAAMLLAKIIKKPFTVKVHGSDINNFQRSFFRKWLIKSVLRNATKIFCVSKSLKNVLIDQYNVPKSKIIVLYNGIDLNHFSPTNENLLEKNYFEWNNQRNILYVGNLKKSKGVHHILSIAQKTNQNISYHIIGTGQIYKWMKNEIKKLNLTERVYLHGQKSHKEIASWIRQAEAVILPSYSEGLPNIILESIACGTPIISTNLVGVREIFDNSSIFGKTVDSVEPELFVEAINEVLSKEWDPLLVENCLKKFSWDGNADRVYEILKNILPEKRC